jgi:hypothetical protein
MTLLTFAQSTSGIPQARDSMIASAIRQLADSVAALGRHGQASGISTADLFGAVGALVAVGTLAAGLWQYIRAQRVDRAKFAMAATREFELDPYVRNAQYMLDWSGRLVALWPDGGENAPAAVLVTHAMVAQALRTTGKPFTDDEVAIRDTFDHFFDHLARFERLVAQGLVTDYNLKPYLGYWCNLLAGARPGHERPYTAAIKTYLNTYGYKDSAALIQRFAGERAVAADN